MASARRARGDRGMIAPVDTVLAALRTHGVAAYRLDAERVWLEPEAAVTPELVALVRAAKPALLPMLPPLPAPHRSVDYDAIYASVAADVGTADDLAAIRHHADLNGCGIVTELEWLDRRCDRLARTGADAATYRAAVLVLVARIDELRRWHLGTGLPPARQRLALERNAPSGHPGILADGTRIDHVGRFVGRLLTAVDYALSHPEVAGSDVVEVWLADLAALGIKARVEQAQ